MIIPSQVSVICKKCSNEFTCAKSRTFQRSICDNCKLDYQKKWNEKNPLAQAAKQRTYRNKHHEPTKLLVYERLGGAICACCGETELSFLTVDHINEDGWKDRSRNSKGHVRSSALSRLQKILKEGCPKDKYQVLCMNCNLGKHRNKGICPHKTVKGVTTISQESTHKCEEAHNLH